MKWLDDLQSKVKNSVNSTIASTINWARENTAEVIQVGAITAGALFYTWKLVPSRLAGVAGSLVVGGLFAGVHIKNYINTQDTRKKQTEDLQKKDADLVVSKEQTSLLSSQNIMLLLAAAQSTMTIETLQKEKSEIEQERLEAARTNLQQRTSLPTTADNGVFARPVPQQRRGVERAVNESSFIPEQGSDSLASSRSHL